MKIDFLRESNHIEGIDLEPSATEQHEFSIFLRLPTVSILQLGHLQSIFAPGKPLRDKPGMNVRVARFTPPPGGPQIRQLLQDILDIAHVEPDPWAVHVAFEHVHPYMDGNGRTGRMLWAWHTARAGRDPFSLSFLHRFYYQTLEHSPIITRPPE